MKPSESSDRAQALPDGRTGNLEARWPASRAAVDAGGVKSTPPRTLFSEPQWRTLATHFCLAPRQIEIARLICGAYRYHSIGVRLGISINTVRMHVRKLFDKTGAHDRVGLIVRLVTTERRLRRQDNTSNGTEV